MTKQEEKRIIRELIAAFNADLEGMPVELRLLIESECPNYLRLRGSEENYIFPFKYLVGIEKSPILKTIALMNDEEFNSLESMSITELFSFCQLTYNVDSPSGDPTWECCKNITYNVLKALRDYLKKNNIKDSSDIVCETFSYYMDKSMFDETLNPYGTSVLSCCSDYEDYMRADKRSFLPDKRVFFSTAAYQESYFLQDIYLYIKFKDTKNSSGIHMFFNICCDDFYDCSEASSKLLFSCIN